MLLVGNGRLVTQDHKMPYVKDGCVAIEGNIIKEVGNTSDIRKKYPDAEFIDAEGKVIMPGMVNTHMHFYSAFARGMASAPSTNFVEILENLWWKLDKALTLEDVKYSALVTIIDCIKNGTTTIFDHHASPMAITDSLFTMAEASKQMGVRSCLCYEVSDRDGQDIMEEGIRENVNFIKHANVDGEDMIKGMFGLHASMTLSNETMEKCAAAMEGLNSGYHIHTAEGIADVYDSLNKYGKRVVQRLMDFNMLGEKTITPHCVHINNLEMEILKETNTNVVHNPESNMGNAVGCAPVIEMMRKGLTVGLGTDGYTSDMFESMKVANIIHKHNLSNPSVAWAEVPTMLFDNNKKIASNYFSRPVGSIEAGAYADLIIVDYNPHTLMNSSNYNSHILFGMTGRSVDTTIANGRILMKNRKLIGVDEAEILSKSREAANKLWNRI
ncbi:putative aminohydrolase SsnA [Clostridium sp. CX1]|uniref:Aminohydrolase SsnA n=1 Tax=Clostridium tanneri TaxID=3037988 RepID=A0ABU4JTY9_9CLOT|nr:MULTISPECIES: putative aminohydrolase SsnA [unclassified Clostridium]MCT8977539.1 putative aminohydrolase SsnA [Clostridium sp. CX1]MDW8801622.1 putative aminohydrolase SsnA [Clostridium sp. A1-XYC3]